MKGKLRLKVIIFLKMKFKPPRRIFLTNFRPPLLTYYWSKQSECAAHEALQMGCVANVVASINTVIFSSSFFLIDSSFSIEKKDN
jgi:hypothetical protein